MLSNASDKAFADQLAACRRTARLGLLLALATALYVVEAQLPGLPLPGARLGLANLVSVLVLYGWGLRETLLLGVLRQVLGGAFTGTLLGMPFYFGLAGTVVSAVCMGLPLQVGNRRMHPVVISLCGAVAHNMAQLGVAYLFVRQSAVLAYLPYLFYLALPAGAAVGVLAQVLLPTLYHELEIADPIPSNSGIRRPQPLVVGIVGILVVSAFVVGYRQWGHPERSRATLLAPLYARVTVNGAEVTRLPLAIDIEYEVSTPTGHLKIGILAGKVQVLEASCPDQICVQTGAVEKTGQALVCVPNKVVVEIKADSSTLNQGAIDAVTW